MARCVKPRVITETHPDGGRSCCLPTKSRKKREDDRKGSKKIAKQSGKERGDFREMENGVANCEGGMKKRELDETNRDGERERESWRRWDLDKE